MLFTLFFFCTVHTVTAKFFSVQHAQGIKRLVLQYFLMIVVTSHISFQRNNIWRNRFLISSMQWSAYMKENQRPKLQSDKLFRDDLQPWSNWRGYLVLLINSWRSSYLFLPFLVCHHQNPKHFAVVFCIFKSRLALTLENVSCRKILFSTGKIQSLSKKYFSKPLITQGTRAVPWYLVDWESGSMYAGGFRDG